MALPLNRARKRSPTCCTPSDTRRSQRIGIEYGNLTVQILECHGCDEICPIEQAGGSAQGNRRQTRGAGSAVDETQALLRLEHQRCKSDRAHRFGAAHASAVQPRPALSQQHQRNVRHVREIAHGSVSRHFRQTIGAEQRESGLRPPPAGHRNSRARNC